MSSAGKHIERLVRRAFISSLSSLPRRARAGRDLSALRAPRILLLRHDRIGDAIVSTPIISLLRERFPDGRIDILLGPKNRSVAPLLADVDEAIILPRKVGGLSGIITRLRRNRYDVAINLLAKDSASGAFFTLASGAGSRIGFEGQIASVYDISIPHSADDLHMVRTTSLLLEPFGIEPIGPEPSRAVEKLHVKLGDGLRDEARRRVDALIDGTSSPILLLNISGTVIERYWGSEKFAELARLARGEGLQPIIASSPADRAKCEAIAAASGARALPTTESFEEFAAMLERADIIVTPDTSVVHLAAALGKPTVMVVGTVLFGSVWGPWGVPHRVVTGTGSLASIAVGDVLRAILSLASATMPAHFPSSAS